MKSIFEYSYFLIYNFAKKYLGEDDIPEFKAFLFLTLIESFWVMNFFIISELIPQLNLKWESFSLFHYITALIVLGLINWFIYLKDKKYLQVYRINNQKQSLVKNLLSLFFFICPVTLPFILISLDIL